MNGVLLSYVIRTNEIPGCTSIFADLPKESITCAHLSLGFVTKMIVKQFIYQWYLLLLEKHLKNELYWYQNEKLNV